MLHAVTLLRGGGAAAGTTASLEGVADCCGCLACTCHTQDSCSVLMTLKEQSNLRGRRNRLPFET